MTAVVIGCAAVALLGLALVLIDTPVAMPLAFFGVTAVLVALVSLPD